MVPAIASGKHRHPKLSQVPECTFAIEICGASDDVADLGQGKLLTDRVNINSIVAFHVRVSGQAVSVRAEISFKLLREVCKWKGWQIRDSLWQCR